MLITLVGLSGENHEIGSRKFQPWPQKEERWNKCGGRAQVGHGATKHLLKSSGQSKGSPVHRRVLAPLVCLPSHQELTSNHREWLSNHSWSSLPVPGASEHDGRSLPPRCFNQFQGFWAKSPLLKPCGRCSWPCHELSITSRMKTSFIQHRAFSKEHQEIHPVPKLVPSQFVDQSQKHTSSYYLKQDLEYSVWAEL